MKFKEILITTFLTLIVLGLFACNFFANKYLLKADSIYEVYLNGTVIGYIENEDELYNLINEKQKEIRDKYDVKNVYPPEDFQIIKTNSYDVEISSVDDIYNKMAKLDSFTLEGYTIKITPPKDSNKKPFYIYTLEKEYFDEAIHNFILAFVSEENYTNYINESQPKIDTVGSIIEQMYFDETMTIKKSYIDVNENIYTNTNDLSKFLLFGKKDAINTYVVKQGDTISSISDANKLNTAEFLIANPEYSSEESLLKIGDKVNVTLIDPVLTFSYEVNDVHDMDVPFEKKTVFDDSKSYTFSEVTTPGVTGVTRLNTIYKVKNGETQSNVIIVSSEEIVQKVDEVTTRGNSGYIGTGSGSYIDTGTNWGWPTNVPYIITSGYEWRWGTFHEGIDISGTGYGSPIYAVQDGVVYDAGLGGTVGIVAGWNVVIQHDNNNYSVYAHMVPYSITVKKGDHVKRGQVIGGMGMSGVATGTHLHYSIFVGGVPYAGGRTINPCSVYTGRC